MDRIAKSSFLGLGFLLLSTFFTTAAHAQGDLPECGVVGETVQVSSDGFCVFNGKIKKYKGDDCLTHAMDHGLKFESCLSKGDKDYWATHTSSTASRSSGNGNCSNGSCGSGLSSSAEGNTGVGFRGGPEDNAGSGAGLGPLGNLASRSNDVLDNGRSGSGSRNNRSSKDDYDELARYCGEEGGQLFDYDKTRKGDVKCMQTGCSNSATWDRNNNLAAYDAAKCEDDDSRCVSIKGLKARMDSALNRCHDACASFALNSKSACFWDTLHNGKDTDDKIFSNGTEFCKNLNAQTEKGKTAEFILAGGAQYGCQASATASNKGDLCRAMAKDTDCQKAMRNDEDFSCQEYQDAAKDWATAISSRKKLNEDITMLTANDSTPRDCSVTNSAQARNAAQKRDSVSIACLGDMQDSCLQSLSKLNKVVREEATAQLKICPTCNVGGGAQAAIAAGSACQTGTCKAMPSTAAQILTNPYLWNAAAQLGTSAMSMASYFKGINACTTQNTALLQAEQQASASTIAQGTAVGLPAVPTQFGGLSNCGTGGYGMSGFGGSSGFGGISTGGYSPFGSSGSGSSFGYSPFSSSLNFGSSLGYGGLNTAGGYSPTSSGYGNYGYSGLGYGSSLYGNTGYGNYGSYGNTGYSNVGYSNSYSGLGYSGQNGYNTSYLAAQQQQAYQAQQQASIMSQFQAQSALPYYGNNTNSALYNPSAAYTGATSSGSYCGYYTSAIPCY